MASIEKRERERKKRRETKKKEHNYFGAIEKEKELQQREREREKKIDLRTDGQKNRFLYTEREREIGMSKSAQIHRYATNDNNNTPIIIVNIATTIKSYGERVIYEGPEIIEIQWHRNQQKFDNDDQ
ncbi:Calcium-dependent secretion activator 1 [Sarcoptes scabiei]|nr:Calcium-dependent secretion activator 1 [Sarcoptes scabiei]